MEPHIRHLNYKFPNGYIEDWSGLDKKIRKSHKSDKHAYQPNVFHPVSMILNIQDNLTLNKEKGYNLKFTNGMLEGKGISINKAGDRISFKERGSYRFEMCGDGVLFSDVDVKISYQSSLFKDEIIPFTQSNVPKEEGKLKLRGISTILPIQEDQTINVKLIPSQEESIMILGGTKLLIYRVA